MLSYRLLALFITSLIALEPGLGSLPANEPDAASPQRYGLLPIMSRYMVAPPASSLQG